MWVLLLNRVRVEITSFKIVPLFMFLLCQVRQVIFTSNGQASPGRQANITAVNLTKTLIKHNKFVNNFSDTQSAALKGIVSSSVRIKFHHMQTSTVNSNNGQTLLFQTATPFGESKCFQHDCEDQKSQEQLFYLCTSCQGLCKY